LLHFLLYPSDVQQD